MYIQIFNKQFWQKHYHQLICCWNVTRSLVWPKNLHGHYNYNTLIMTYFWRARCVYQYISRQTSNPRHHRHTDISNGSLNLFFVLFCVERCTVVQSKVYIYTLYWKITYFFLFKSVHSLSHTVTLQHLAKHHDGR